jgi:hypothetical protein
MTRLYLKFLTELMKYGDIFARFPKENLSGMRLVMT